ncbi:MAG: GNAT family N-acetyltransferase [Burkholderiaceae bacterium]|nr:GNAT family N-acetyltransferase [Burkholderiaceae bacterium]
MNCNDDDTPGIELQTGNWAQLGEAAGALRLAVFVREQGIPAALEYDAWDARSMHCVAWCDGEPVATGRLLPDGHIGRMAVRADQRGRGIGRRVLQALMALARQRGDTSVELSAQSRVEGFYRAHGFEPVGEPYEEIGIPHLKMRRSLLVLAAWAGAAIATGGAAPARAAALDAVSNADAIGALRATLERGAGQAVAALGRPGGFLDDPKVRIPLPDGLRQAEGLLRATGRGRELDELVTSMNRAAEQAVPQAKQLLLAAVKSMSVADAKSILTGGEDSVTQFFQSRTQAPLTERFLPIVTQQVSRLGLAKRYNALAGQASKLGLLKARDASVERYVTTRALDGLYLMIAEEERAIRRDPLKAGSKVIERVFGALP